MQIHLDLVCAKLRDTKERLDLACTKLKNTEEELHNTKEHLKNFKETTKKHEERINALENKPFIYTWKINCFHRILEEAKTGNVVRIQSDPFYTSECGYKGGLRLYPNGSSLGKNTHMSIYLIIMKGDFDSILIWPFAKRVTVTLLDQQENSNDRKNITVTHPPNQLQQGLNSRPLGELTLV